MRAKRHISRTDDAVDILELFQSVCAPADDSGCREKRCVQARRQAEHVVDQTAEEVDVRVDALLVSLTGRDQLRCEILDRLVQTILFVVSLGVSKLLYITLQHFRTWIGYSVNRMSDTIDQALFIKDFLIQDRLQISLDLIDVLPMLAPPCLGPLSDARAAAIVE